MAAIFIRVLRDLVPFIPPKVPWPVTSFIGSFHLQSLKWPSSHLSAIHTFTADVMLSVFSMAPGKDKPESVNIRCEGLQKQELRWGHVVPELDWQGHPYKMCYQV